MAEGHEIDFEDRFRKRVHLVDQSPGFVRNEVHRPRPVKFSHETGTFEPDPDSAGYYEVKTWWRSLIAVISWPLFPKCLIVVINSLKATGSNILNATSGYLATG